MGTNGWIDVNERLPEKDGRYLVVWASLPVSVDVCYFENEDEEDENSPGYFYMFEEDPDKYWRCTNSIKYWMPLPEAPQE